MTPRHRRADAGYRGEFVIRPTGVGLIPHGDKYSVKDLGDSMQGYIDLVKRELGVSLNGACPWTRWVQLHELTHVLASRARPDAIATKAGVQLVSVLAAEDARVNTKMLDRVPDAHKGFGLGDQPLRNDLSGYVAGYNAPAVLQKQIGKAIAKADPANTKRMHAMDAVFAKLKDRPLTLRDFTVPMAKALDEVYTSPPEMDGESMTKAAMDAMEEAGKHAHGLGKTDEEAFGEEDGAAEEHSAHGGAFTDKPSTDPRSGKKDPDIDPEERWIIPSVETPALTVSVLRPGTHDFAPSDTGTDIRDVTRVATDGMVFGRSLRRPGTVKRGTILIDVSGSMRITDRDIETLIHSVPMATVAVYSSRPGREAWVVIVARDGKRIERISSARCGSGNGCDGPALLWLSRMPVPRVWVCDGMVTGFHDTTSPMLNGECCAIVEAGHILHVNPDRFGGDGTLSGDVLSALRARRLVR